MCRVQELLGLPEFPGAFKVRDLVRLWEALDGTGRMAVVSEALDNAERIRKATSLFIKRQRFLGTDQRPQRKWRSAGPGWRTSGSVESIDLTTVEGLERLIRTVAADPFLGDECILWRVPIQHGHFAIGGHERRITIVGLTSDHHYNGVFVGEVRERLHQLIVPPPAGHEAWADQVSVPDWAETQRWMNHQSEQL